ncbi:right-handed parallel beta-helix repeat-containing protein [Thermodesulfobacteriota bacterium]
MKWLKTLFTAVFLLSFLCSISFSKNNFFTGNAQKAKRPTIKVPEEFETIQEAIDSASDGYLILVDEGTYSENINFNGKKIIVKSLFGAEETIIDGDGKGATVSFNSGENRLSVLDGFSIINGAGSHRYSSGAYGGGIDCYNSSSPTIKNCLIYDNEASGYGGGICCWKSAPTIESCKIYDNSGTKGGGGIYLESSRAIIRNCIISNNKTEALGGGIFYNACSPATTNCTISENSAKIAGGGIYLENSSSPKITNCIVRDNIATTKSPEIGTLSEKSSPKVTYSNIKGGYKGDGNIDGDPDYSTGINRDFHLTINSPCIDAGTAERAPKHDLNGVKRPLGKGFDIGAYEDF